MFLNLVTKSLRNSSITIHSNQFTCAKVLIPRIGCLLAPPSNDNFLQTRSYAARKGTRIKRAMEAKKRALARKMLPKPEKRKFTAGSSAQRIQVLRSDPTGKPLPPDDVYFTEGFTVPSYSISDALSMHRETHSSTIFGLESNLLHARIEVYMKAKRKTKFIDGFSSTVTYPFPFPLQRRSRIIAIAKTVEEQEAAKAAGAILAGGDDIIRNIKSGLVSSIDYEHLVCHTDMLIPLTAVRGLIGDNFPSKSKGNFGTDIVALVKKFAEGYDYQCKKNISQDNFGYIDLAIGTLNMEDDKLAANLLALITDSERHRPSDAPGQFPETVWLISPETEEKFKIKFWELSDKYVDIFESDKYKDQVEAILKTVKAETSAKV
ncbi:39S ribosomal protein L1, mitochondrial [Tetranychus urticae]|uniref:Ribosomal protein L1 n=1 Tax=Tetranychus urticae TaxID=32264 RepID=T1KSS4_TETUR|nr:39S ribosomal protein L1, mitochondrial [Tetranychus urticae]